MKIAIGDMILLAPVYDRYGNVNKLPSLPCLVEQVDDNPNGDGIDITVLILENGDSATFNSENRYFRKIGHLDGTYTPNYKGYDHPDFLNWPTHPVTH